VIGFFLTESHRRGYVPEGKIFFKIIKKNKNKKTEIKNSNKNESNK